MSQAGNFNSALVRWQRRALVTFAVAGTLCVAGALYQPAEFYPAYLVGYLFWLGISLGCWGVSMLHNLTGGSWGVPIRRILESAAATVPLLALLFLPILFGMQHLYSWSRPDVLASDPVAQAKSQYLNLPGFTMRAGIYFAIWILWPYLLNRCTAGETGYEHAGDGPLRRHRRLQLLSGPGLVLYGLSITFASIDWAMSLDPDWYSSIFPVIIVGGQALSGLSFAILTALLLANFRPWLQTVTTGRLHDLGNLLLAFVMFWAYVSFMQYLIIWSGNLPEEISWYIDRRSGGWQFVAGILMFCHFAIPFLLLLSRQNKRDAGRLAPILGWLLAMRFIDLYWTVIPTFAPQAFTLHWLGIVAPLAIGGAWMLMFTWRLSVRAAWPVAAPEPEDEHVERALAH